ncbi:Alcohol dehydrogenase [Sporothrix eucalyptigena]|uniref:Alcohol dehydrogenase n=1 Tax=Sporothrix eucalyptigena TaxID=1812306 RepID=A0ABP0BNX7_9PEZI
MATNSIPSVQRAAVLTEEYGKLHTYYTDFPVPQFSASQVLIKLQASGICSGDLNTREGYPPAPKVPQRPLVTGHEGVGVIVAVGDEVTAFKPGDRVGMGWRSVVCRNCEDCNEGRDNLCQKQKINGYESNGTFQGKWVCVTGAAGGVGSLACCYALHMGLKVIAIDSAQKAAVCEALGVHAFVDYENADTVVSRIIEVTGGTGAHGVVVCSANPASYSQAVEYAAVGGRIVSIGPSMVHLHTGHLMVKGLGLIAQCNGATKDIQDAVKMGIEDGILPQVELVQINSVDEALDKLKAGRTLGRQVLDWS